MPLSKLLRDVDAEIVLWDTIYQCGLHDSSPGYDRRCQFRGYAFLNAIIGLRISEFGLASFMSGRSLCEIYRERLEVR